MSDPIGEYHRLLEADPAARTLTISDNGDTQADFPSSGTGDTDDSPDGAADASRSSVRNLLISRALSASHSALPKAIAAITLPAHLARLMRLSR